MLFIKIHADAAPAAAEGEEEEEEEKNGVKVLCGDVYFYRKIAPWCLRGPLPDHRSEHVCVLAVPNRMTMAAFCDFIGSFMKNIREMHVVRNNSQMDRYIILIDFSNQNSADKFYLQFNGRLFFSPSAEVCHILFTENIKFTESGDEAALTPIGLTKLPTCPVCLERFDEDISGIMITSSGSSSGSTCISEWEASCCPVCISCQQHADQFVCSVCYTSEKLWICVMCGFVGCGRFQSGHAMKHWKETQHRYYLDLLRQRIWDHEGGGFVHRPIQSKTDGKVVELSTTNQNKNDDCGKYECSDMPTIEEALFAIKMDAARFAYDGKKTKDLSIATIHQIKLMGLGDHVCVDLCSLLAPGEGLLVGSFARGLFLVHSECLETKYIASRSFRVNAGPVHAHVEMPGGRTCYLSELRSGMEVLVTNNEGKQRRAIVGRVKIESRPLILIEAKVENSDILYSLLLENAETVSLVKPSSSSGNGSGCAALVTSLKVGDKVLLSVGEEGARHTSWKIEEFIIEK